MSSTAGRRYLQLLGGTCGQSWRWGQWGPDPGLPGSPGTGWPRGRVGGLSEGPSLSRMSLGLSLLSGAFLPSVLGRGLARAGGCGWD